MQIHMVSMGCARNLVDSEEMLGRFARAGWTITDTPQKARAIVVNTCCFVEPAADESIDIILEMARMKTDGACRVLAVAGCLPQRYGPDTAESLPEVDVFVGTGGLSKIVEVVTEALTRTEAAPVCLFPDPNAAQVSNTAGNRTPIDPGTPFAYIKIAEGCDRRCTYCIIPRLRGRRRSLSPGGVMETAAHQIATGAKEIVLVAQDTTAYGTDLTPATSLPELLESLASRFPDVWIRFLYGHPESITMETVKTIGRHQNLCPYIDLPIQHASDAVLRRMGRRYTKNDLVRLFAAIREHLPGASLRTTLITGFPGETEEEAAETLAFIKEIRFDHLGVFTYSDAADLASHGIAPAVPAKTAEDRRERLMTVQQQISEEITTQYVDQTLTVLLEENPEPNLFTGRTVFQAPEVDGMVYVHTPADRGLQTGDFTRVLVTDALPYDLVGEVV